MTEERLPYADVKIEPATMTMDGERYLLLPARIEGTHLGFEDHGIFTGWLALDYENGGAQGAGLRCMDRPGPDHSRRGTAYGTDWIIRVLEVVGVETWERLPGRRLYAVKGDGDAWGTVQGIASLDDPRGRLLLFDKHAEAFSPDG